MLHSERGSFPLRIGVALAAALLLFSFPAASSDTAIAPPAPTDAQCSQKWGDSEADDSCQNESISVDGVQCRVQADCLMTITEHNPTETNSTSLGGTYSSTEILATLDDVARLYNCGGVLTIGSC